MILVRGITSVLSIRHRRVLLLWGALLLLPGCAIYDPYQVWRFHADFNTERGLSAQWMAYDHLPPKRVRMRLMKWGYNVGPSPVRMPFAIPDDSPVQPLMPPSPGAIPGPGGDLLEEARPPALPRIEEAPPPYPLSLPKTPASGPEGPTALRSSARTATQASWIFSTP